MQNATNKTTKATETKAAKARKPAKRLTKAEAEAKQAEIVAQHASRGIARAAATIEADNTNFAQFSGRDAAYLFFFGKIMRDNKTHAATLAEIQAAGQPKPSKTDKARTINPHYAGGSALSIDAGVINRLCRDGYFTKADDGNKLIATDQARTNKHYNGKA